MKKQYNINGAKVPLTAGEADLLQRFVGGGRIGDALVLNEIKETRPCLRVKVCNLRRTLKPHGIAIDFVRGKFEMIGIKFFMEATP
jgi:hypothetical protein